MRRRFVRLRWQYCVGRDIRFWRLLKGGDAFLICEKYEGPIHLMLTDVVMPRMDGMELAQRLLSMRPEMKVIYMSGYADNAILRHGFLEEGVDYIQKPFTVSRLARKVREVLDKDKKN
jgi:two-component system cell cycle sensor histidine kinase/response regulator CckA